MLGFLSLVYDVFVHFIFVLRDPEGVAHFGVLGLLVLV